MGDAADKALGNIFGKGAIQSKKQAIEGKKPVRDVGLMEDIAKGLGSGIGRGFVGIAGVPGDIEMISRMLSGYEGKAAKKYTEEQLASMPSAAAEAIRATAAREAPDMAAPTRLPTSQRMYRLAEKVLPEGTLTYKPSTMPGRIAQMGGEFAGPGAIGRAPIKGAAMYGTAGLASGTAAELDPRLGLATGIATGTAAGIGASRMRGPEKMLREAVGEQTPASEAAASQRQRIGQELGLPLTAAESMDSPALRTLAATVAATPEGAGIISQRLLGRQEAIPQAIERGILGVEAAPISLTGEAARQTREAAKSAIRSVEGARTSKVTDLSKLKSMEGILLLNG